MDREGYREILASYIPLNYFWGIQELSLKLKIEVIDSIMIGGLEGEILPDDCSLFMDWYNSFKLNEREELLSINLMLHKG